MHTHARVREDLTPIRAPKKDTFVGPQGWTRCGPGRALGRESALVSPLSLPTSPFYPTPFSLCSFCLLERAVSCVRVQVRLLALPARRLRGGMRAHALCEFMFVLGSIRWLSMTGGLYGGARQVYATRTHTHMQTRAGLILYTHLRAELPGPAGHGAGVSRNGPRDSRHAPFFVVYAHPVPPVAIGQGRHQSTHLPGRPCTLSRQPGQR
jgi:hypothetical protein